VGPTGRVTSGLFPNATSVFLPPPGALIVPLGDFYKFRVTVGFPPLLGGTVRPCRASRSYGRALDPAKGNAFLRQSWLAYDPAVRRQAPPSVNAFLSLPLEDTRGEPDSATFLRGWLHFPHSAVEHFKGALASATGFVSSGARTLFLKTFSPQELAPPKALTGCGGTIVVRCLLWH